ncbi:hypothetical protein FRX31_027850, partial [Thalictrum thalictroides]
MENNVWVGICPRLVDINLIKSRFGKFFKGLSIGPGKLNTREPYVRQFKGVQEMLEGSNSK